MMLVEKETETLRATLAHQEAHLALLTERYVFLTTREAESRRQTFSAHEQLALRDADYRSLLTNYDSQRRELINAHEQLLHAQGQVTHLSVQQAALSAEQATLSAEQATTKLEWAKAARYTMDLERSWHEKNAHIAALEHRLNATPPTLITRVLRRLPLQGRQ